MKTLTALILVLASLITVYAMEFETSDQAAVQLPINEGITLNLIDNAPPAEGECKAVCMLPPSFD